MSEYYAYPAPPSPYYPQPQPQPRPVRQYWIIGGLLALLAIAVAVVVVVLAGGHGDNNTGQGFLNPTTLAADLQSEAQARAEDPGSAHYVPGVQINTVYCVPLSTPQDFRCIIQYTLDGMTNSETDTAHVSPDGQSYVTDQYSP
jgi:hypothetical protein